MTSILKTDEIQSQNGSSAIDVANGTLKHPSASGNNLELASDGTTTVSGALTASGGIANAGTISAGTLGPSVVFPGPATGAFGGHILQVGNGIFTPTADIVINTTDEAFGPVVSMVMKNANAKVLGIVVMSEMSSSTTDLLILNLVYKNSTTGTLNAGDGTSLHGGTTLTTYQQTLRVFNSGPGTVVLGGTVSNSAGDTIQFAGQGVTSSGDKFINNAGGNARVTLTVFELQT